MITFAEEDPMAPEVPLDDLITYYTLRHKFYHQSSDEATIRRLCLTRLIQQALYELDIIGTTSLFLRFHNLPATEIMSAEKEK